MDRDRELHEMADEGRALMSDYIKREDAIKAFDPRQRQDWYTPWIVETLKDLPSADVAPVRHGRWELNTDMTMHCSCCGELFRFDDKDGCLDFMECAKYCIACGAKMDEGGSNGTDNK